MSIKPSRRDSIDTDRGCIPRSFWPREGSPANQTGIALHLAPANGFTVGSYGELASLLARHYEVFATENRGAWGSPSAPPEDWTWIDHADDLIAGIEATTDQPVHGIGHSIGGTVTLIAAVKRPDLFRRLAIIDPASLSSKPFSLVYNKIPEWLSFRLFKFIRGSHFRQRVFESPEHFIEKYRGHPTYRQFTSGSLHRYAESGLKERADGKVELVFDPSWESFNFRRTHYLWNTLPHVTTPTLLLRAEHTYMYTQARFDRLNRRLPAHLHPRVIPNASHLVPFEDPTTVADFIIPWLIEAI